MGELRFFFEDILEKKKKNCEEKCYFLNKDKGQKLYERFEQIVHKFKDIIEIQKLPNLEDIKI